MRAKRQALEEDTLKKRLSIHEKNSKELSDRIKSSEERHSSELDALKIQNEERVSELSQERNELKEKLIGIEK